MSVVTRMKLVTRSLLLSHSSITNCQNLVPVGFFILKVDFLSVPCNNAKL